MLVVRQRLFIRCQLGQKAETSDTIRGDPLAVNNCGPD